MGRPPGSKNKAAVSNGEDVHPTDPPDEGGGSNTKPDDTAECFLELKGIDSAIASLGQKKARTIARYENMGVDVDAVRYCQKLENKDDAPDWIKRVLAAAAQLSIIPTETEDDGQITLMPGLRVAAVSQKAMDKLSIARAHGDGYNSGRHGGSADNNPFEAGTEVYVAWGNGCMDGAADKAIAKSQREDKKARNRAAEVDAEPGTVLERDEAAYRAGTQEHVTMPADPV